MLRLKFLAGLFEHPYADADEAERVTNTPDAQALALDAARESLVLLKNDKQRAAARPREGQDARRRSGRTRPTSISAATARIPGRGVSILQGIKDKAGRGEGRLRRGLPHHRRARRAGAPTRSSPADPAKNAQRIADAVKIASTADAIVAVDRHERIDVARSLCRQPPRRHGDARPDQPAGAIWSTRSSRPASPSSIVLMNGRPLSITRRRREGPGDSRGLVRGPGRRHGGRRGALRRHQSRRQAADQRAAHGRTAAGLLQPQADVVPQLPVRVARAALSVRPRPELHDVHARRPQARRSRRSARRDGRR